MGEIVRPLLDDNQIVSFLSVLDFETYFSNPQNLARVFQDVQDVSIAMAQTITLIREANKDLAAMVTHNTLDSESYRATPYITDAARQQLREEIRQQLISNIRPSNDENINFGNGGMLPTSGIVRKNREAFVIIGLPASGKSGVAAKISDYYQAVLIDSDFAKRKIPEFCKTNGATLVHKESKLIKDDILKAAIIKGLNFVLPIIGNDYNEVLNTIKSLRKHKYSVKFILVELDRIEATRRALSRFIQTQRYIPLSRILDEYSNDPSLVFYKLMYNQPELSMALIDTNVPYGEKPKIVVKRNFDELKKIL